MYWTKLFVLGLCVCLIVERHGVLGQALMCNAGEMVMTSFVFCTMNDGCMPALTTILGRFLFGLADMMCTVSSANGVISVAFNGPDACSVFIRTCLPITMTTTPVSMDTTTLATTTTVAAVDSPESPESGSFSRRR